MESVLDRQLKLDPSEPKAKPSPAAPLSVLVLTYNEEKNISACLESLQGVAGECIIVDSGSTDGTVAIAERLGAKVVTHAFAGFAQQWNWALRNCPISYDWALCLDADQRLTPELSKEISRTLELSLPGVDGFYMNRRPIFLGRWLRHGAYYPKFYLKLIRHRNAWSDDREYLDARFYVNGKVARFRHDLIEDNRKDNDLLVWAGKHLGYAARQALEEFHRRNGRLKGFGLKPLLFGNPDERTIWQKSLWYRLPLYLRPFLYFSYRYFFRLGFLDGKEGFIFHFLHAFWYRLMVDTQIDRLGQETRRD